MVFLGAAAGVAVVGCGGVGYKAISAIERRQTRRSASSSARETRTPTSSSAPDEELPDYAGDVSKERITRIKEHTAIVARSISQIYSNSGSPKSFGFDESEEDEEEEKPRGLTEAAEITNGHAPIESHSSSSSFLPQRPAPSSEEFSQMREENEKLRQQLANVTARNSVVEANLDELTQRLEKLENSPAPSFLAPSASQQLMEPEMLTRLPAASPLATSSLQRFERLDVPVRPRGTTLSASTPTITPREPAVAQLEEALAASVSNALTPVRLSAHAACMLQPQSSRPELGRLRYAAHSPQTWHHPHRSFGSTFSSPSSSFLVPSVLHSPRSAEIDKLRRSLQIPQIQHDNPWEST